MHKLAQRIGERIANEVWAKLDEQSVVVTGTDAAAEGRGTARGQLIMLVVNATVSVTVEFCAVLPVEQVVERRCPQGPEGMDQRATPPPSTKLVATPADEDCVEALGALNAILNMRNGRRRGSAANLAHGVVRGLGPGGTREPSRIHRLMP